MADGNLNTTNILLGIMPAVSVLQALAPLAAHVHALMARVDAIVGDVKDVTGRVTRQTGRVDTAIRHTMHRVDETADRVRESVGSRISQLMRLVHGVICAVQSLFTGRRASTEAPAI